MVDTMSKRRTHYEVLGLTPAANVEEIEQAFAREVSMFRPYSVSELAEATIAFQALRDPARRRAYDRSLEPEPRKSPMTWGAGTQFMTATAAPVMRLAVDRPTPLEPQVDARPRLEERPGLAESGEPPIVPFIAAALRQLASPEPLAVPASPASQMRTEEVVIPPAPDPAPLDLPDRKEGTADGDRRVCLAVNESLDGAVYDGIPLKRAGIVLGTVTAGVALLGAWAGWESIGAADPVQNGAKTVLPPPTTYTVRDTASTAPDAVLDELRGEASPARQPGRSATRVARPRSFAAAPRIRSVTAPNDRAIDPLAPNADAPVDGAAAPPTAVAASLPLPNHVIARTIDRIGYRCGEVTSATGSGTPGVFTVTCTSGSSYRASPLRGRYHFRRLSRG